MTAEEEERAWWAALLIPWPPEVAREVVAAELAAARARGVDVHARPYRVPFGEAGYQIAVVSSADRGEVWLGLVAVFPGENFAERFRAAIRSGERMAVEKLGVMAWSRDRLDHEPMHGWFGLSYANYLVLERSLLQSMPVDWQWRLFGLLEELEERFAGLERAAGFKVRATDCAGHKIKDPVPHYDRGRTRIPQSLQSLGIHVAAPEEECPT